ncbi:hypothetical protein LJC56_08330 [Christensenellaceae bacterium OttesenSCG-928-K19]|nr:hypothetical protein [Christensenellaceae bacterium OttesenSCG-928-K19]
MKRKLLCGILAVMLVFALSACAASVDEELWFGVHKNENGYVSIDNYDGETLIYTFVMNDGTYLVGPANVNGNSAWTDELLFTMDGSELTIAVDASEVGNPDYEIFAGVYSWVDEELPIPEDPVPEEEVEPIPEPTVLPLISAEDPLEQSLVLPREEGVADVQFFYPSTMVEITPREDELYARLQDNTGTEPDMELTVLGGLTDTSQFDAADMTSMQAFIASANQEAIGYFYPDSTISGESAIDEVDFSLVTYFTITNTASDTQETESEEIAYMGVCKSMLREAQGGIFMVTGIAVCREDRVSEYEMILTNMLTGVQFLSKEEPAPEPVQGSSSGGQEDWSDPGDEGYEDYWSDSDGYGYEDDYDVWSDPGDGDDAWSDPGDYGDW